MRTTSFDSTIGRLVRVEKSYGAVQALAGMDLELRRGEVLALLGANGAGKTTAVSLLLGLLRPDAGKVRVFGDDPRSLAVRCRIGAMLQNSGVAPKLTVAEQIDLFRSYYPRPAAVADLIAAAGLSTFLHQRAVALSGGQLQRLMFALALAGDPELLFLDEPTTGLDVESRRRLWGSIRQLTALGRTVLLTTHHLEEATALADRVVVIDRGRCIAEGTPAELEAKVSGRRIRCVTTLSLDAVRALRGVRLAERRGIATEILTADAEAVLRELLARDPSLHELEVGGVGLEQAFLALTGQGAAGQTQKGQHADHEEEAA